MLYFLFNQKTKQMDILKKEEIRDQVINLDEAMIFIVKLIYTEVDHDPDLVKEGRHHLKSLLCIHEHLIEEAEAVL